MKVIRHIQILSSSITNVVFVLPIDITSFLLLIFDDLSFYLNKLDDKFILPLLLILFLFSFSLLLLRYSVLLFLIYFFLLSCCCFFLLSTVYLCNSLFLWSYSCLFLLKIAIYKV